MSKDENKVGSLGFKYVGQTINDREKGVSYTLVYSTRPEMNLLKRKKQ